jgi:hypothetical protein
LRIAILWYLKAFIFFVLFLSHTSLAAFAKLQKALLALSCLSACLSIHIGHLGSQWMDFCEILYWRVLLKCVKKIQVLLKLDKALGTSHGDLSMFMMIAC